MAYIVEPQHANVDIAGESSCLNIALVNNMPDAALAQTERQFGALLAAAAFDTSVQVRYYSLPGLARGEAAAEHIRRTYRPLDELWDSPVDALIVTGCEPRAARVSDEPYWDQLRGVLAWGCRHTGSVIASCLAAHAALLAFDGVERRKLGTKRSGVFEQHVATDHPLGAGLTSRVRIPHSRLNDVPIAAVQSAGYRPIVSSADIGWTIATKDVDGCLLVLVQGHPEYEPETLLLEYRRDVRRYLHGERDAYPEPPQGYLAPEVEAEFDQFRASVEAAPDPAQLERFPFDRALVSVECPWRAPSARLYANWLAEVARRALPVEVAHA
jgi:homoserine O-succinyltransferase/O-acetyltransferase